MQELTHISPGFPFGLYREERYNEATGARKKWATAMATDKTPSSYRLSDRARGLIDRLADHLGVSKTDVIEIAVRSLARRELEGVAEPAPKRPRGRPRR